MDGKHRQADAQNEAAAFKANAENVQELIIKSTNRILTLSELIKIVDYYNQAIAKEETERETESRNLRIDSLKMIIAPFIKQIEDETFSQDPLIPVSLKKEDNIGAGHCLDAKISPQVSKQITTIPPQRLDISEHWHLSQSLEEKGAGNLSNVGEGDKRLSQKTENVTPASEQKTLIMHKSKQQGLTPWFTWF